MCEKVMLLQGLSMRGCYLEEDVDSADTVNGR